MRIALISMPWAIFNRPSIQLGTLKGYLRQELGQVEVQCCHPYLDVAAAVGLDNYRLISENPWAAEALYCGLLFPGQQAQASQVFRQFMQGTSVPDYRNLLPILETQLQSWLDRQDFGHYDLVGFSVCFSQLPASLYAARAIHRNWPDTPIVFGGSTCTPALGHSLLNIFPEIDFIITGEGEQPLKELLLHLSRNADLTSPSILTRKCTAFSTATNFKNQEIADLATLPLPDYHDYFQQMKAEGLDFIPVLPLEFSRGCWWNKCTFCNLNLQWQGYRYKKSRQVLNEVKAMVQSYHCIDFTFTDNALPVKEADLFFAATADWDLDLHFFGEIRTLKKATTYNQYRKGGLNSVQIGIEAMSDTLLARMCKGTTVMDNVAAMKFAQAAGMVLDGNLILEFPGSTEQEVSDTLRLLDLVLPFRPLTAAGFFLGHGSPVCNRPREFGIKSIVQHPINQKLYPADVLDGLDMLIKSYRGDRTVQTTRWKPVRDKIVKWHAFHNRRPNPSIPPLSYRDGGTFLIIRQELPDSPPLHHRLRGLSRRIYLACEQPVTKKRLLSLFSQVTKKQLYAFLADLERKNILYCDATSCLALAVRTP
jgi:ribosomal peptide maturation radical SAM protein 1